MEVFGFLTDGGEVKSPPLPKTCHIYLAIIAYMNHMIHPLRSADIIIFSPEIKNFVISRNTDIDCILIHNL